MYILTSHSMFQSLRL